MLSLGSQDRTTREKQKKLISSPLHRQELLHRTRSHSLRVLRCMRRRLARAAAQTLEEVLLLNKSSSTTTTTTTMVSSTMSTMKTPSAATASSSSFSSCLGGSSRSGTCARCDFKIEKSLFQKKSKGAPSTPFVRPQIGGMARFFFFCLFFAPTQSPLCFLLALFLIASEMLRRLVIYRRGRRSIRSKRRGEATR